MTSLNLRSAINHKKTSDVKHCVKAKDQQRVANGKPAKIVLTAIM